MLRRTAYGFRMKVKIEVEVDIRGIFANLGNPYCVAFYEARKG